nr:adenylate kinase family protein [Candidatus Sigynarchaeota archaeon]
MVRILAISGTPAVGKTSVAAALKELLKAEVISLTEFVKSRSLVDSWDKQKDTGIVDEDRLREALLKEIGSFKEKSIPWLIIEGLLADVVADACDYAVVLRLHPRVVKARLEQRDYSESKIAENVQSEVLGTCTYHMQEARGNDFYDIDTTGKTISDIAHLITDLVDGRVDRKAVTPGLVDWISDPDFDLIGTFQDNTKKREKKIRS